MFIDTSFDFRADLHGKDPDAHSPTLRRYHRFLWSKPLPSGRPFDLSDTDPHVYLYHHSELGRFFLSSDSVIPTYTRRLKHITALFPEEENKAFESISYTIGGMMVFPGNRIDGKYTINVARGFNSKIADRMDLTLECIRRHYLGENSPLRDVLARYREYFALFDDFRGYVDFFLLQDLVNDNRGKVNFHMPFDDFKPPSTPRDKAAYVAYRNRAVEFINSRNRRIDKYATSVTPAVVVRKFLPDVRT